MSTNRPPKSHRPHSGVDAKIATRKFRYCGVVSGNNAEAGTVLLFSISLLRTIPPLDIEYEKVVQEVSFIILFGTFLVLAPTWWIRRLSSANVSYWF